MALYTRGDSSESTRHWYAQVLCYNVCALKVEDRRE